ncbi:MAG: O-antigen ligase family protein [bacterium]
MSCFLLALGTIQTLGPLGGAERIIPKMSHFDILSLLKLMIRFLVLVLVGHALILRRRDPFFRTYFLHLLPFFGFASWGFLTSFWSPLPFYSGGHAMDFLLLVMFGLLTAVLVANEIELSQVFFVLCLNHFSYLLILFVLFLLFPDSATILRSEIDTEKVLFTTNSVSSFIVNPAEIASVASLGVILIVAARHFWGWPWVTYLLLPSLILEIVILFLTQTRSMIILAFLLSAAILFLAGKRKILWYAFFLTVVFLSAWMIGEPEHGRTNFLQDYLLRGQSQEQLTRLSGRLDTWTVVYDNLSQNELALFFGFGYSMATRTGMKMHEGEMKRYTAHNIFLHVLSGTGIVGLSLFFWGFFHLTAVFYSGWKKFSDRRSIYLTLLIFCFIFLMGMVSDSIVGPISVTYVSIFVVLGAGLASSIRPPGVQDMAPAGPFSEPFPRRRSGGLEMDGLGGQAARPAGWARDR